MPAHICVPRLTRVLRYGFPNGGRRITGVGCGAARRCRQQDGKDLAKPEQSTFEKGQDRDAHKNNLIFNSFMNAFLQWRSSERLCGAGAGAGAGLGRICRQLWLDPDLCLRASDRPHRLSNCLRTSDCLRLGQGQQVLTFRVCLVRVTILGRQIMGRIA